MRCMASLQDRAVIVSAGALDEALELTRVLTDRLPQDDPMVLALRGVMGQLRASAIVEPG